MLAPDQTAAQLAFTPMDARSLLRRVGLLALLAAAAVLMVLLAGGRVHAVADALRRGLAVNGGWAAAAIAFECVSLAGYVALLSLVAGRATARIGVRESAQITFAGAAATRLLPTAGAGGAGLALWTLRRAGLGARVAARTLLAFLVVLYAVFLVAMVISGGALALGLAGGRGPVALSAIPAIGAMLGVALALFLARGGREEPDTGVGCDTDADDRSSRLRRGGRLLGEAVREACRLVRMGDPRLAGAVAYWAFDAAVLWAMLRAFGTPPVLPVIVLAYLVGQVANTLPIPGSVSGGIAGVLIALGVPAGLALPAVLAYRTVSVWLPTPVAVAALPGLRSTIERWGREPATTNGSG